MYPQCQKTEFLKSVKYIYLHLTLMILTHSNVLQLQKISSSAFITDFTHSEYGILVTCVWVEREGGSPNAREKRQNNFNMRKICVDIAFKWQPWEINTNKVGRELLKMAVKHGISILVDPNFTKEVTNVIQPNNGPTHQVLDHTKCLNTSLSMNMSTSMSLSTSLSLNTSLSTLILHLTPQKTWWIDPL